MSQEGYQWGADWLKDHPDTLIKFEGNNERSVDETDKRVLELMMIDCAKAWIDAHEDDDIWEVNIDDGHGQDLVLSDDADEQAQAYAKDYESDFEDAIGDWHWEHDMKEE